MSEFQDQVTVNAPLDQVFNFAADVENAPLFMQNVTKVEKLTDGPVQAGTKYRETREIRGREATAVIEFIEYVPSAKYSVKSEMKGMEAIYHYMFSASGNQTTIRFECEINAKKFTMKLIKPVFVKIMKKEDGDHLQHLKKALEAQAAEDKKGQ
ncbi:SRPBCC family protein [Bacillus sp. CMF21]|uniref:SRPBCC family protein n=1 Tax=Metabacillus dongyingensis TaxID=2874282 RepID=UPI001CBFB9FF|nr:SRPBCC family protein [Metabacillus dongyingensis]UAL53352.1 SRPBCC family protein [Metabacillus dongyingensis]USK29674.1 SRPBCC family protein [Bacillus sp. CMF21]